MSNVQLRRGFLASSLGLVGGTLFTTSPWKGPGTRLVR